MPKMPKVMESLSAFNFYMIDPPEADLNSCPPLED